MKRQPPAAAPRQNASLPDNRMRAGGGDDDTDGDGTSGGGSLKGKPAASLPDTYSCASRAALTFVCTTDSALWANRCSIAAHRGSMLNPISPIAAPSAAMFIDALLPAFSAMFVMGTRKTPMSGLRPPSRSTDSSQIKPPPRAKLPI